MALRQYDPVVQGPELLKSRHVHRPVFRFWVWELIFLALAVGCLVAISVVIDRQNGKPVEQWTFAITLNSLVALLSTILRGIMVAIAGEVIAQEKWAWLWSSSPSSRPLRTLYDFDQGSRGIWGALLLIPTAARRSPSTLLAIVIIILSFAIGPFVQQSITTMERDFTATGLQDDAVFNIKTLPSLPISHSINELAENTYFKVGEGISGGTWKLHPRIRGNTINALSDFDRNASTIIPSCETGNCTFPSAESLRDTDFPDTEATHVSLGLCSKCFDLTGLISEKGGTTSLANSALEPWPAGFDYNLGITTKPGNLSWVGSAIDFDAHASILRHSLANVTILSRSRTVKIDTSDRAGSGYIAATCALYLCMKTFHSSIQRGEFSEKLLHTSPLVADITGYDEELGPVDVQNADICSPGQGFKLTGIQSPCRVNDKIYTYFNMSFYSPPESANQSSLLSQPLHLTSGPVDLQSAPPQCVYPVTCFMARMFSELYAADIFNSTCTYNSRQGSVIDCKDKWWLTPLWEENEATFKSISDEFDGFARRVTSSFRTGMAKAPGTQDSIVGMAHRTVAVTIVDWRWLLLPIGLLAIELMVLGWVVFRGWWNRERNGEMVWKSNVLPFVFYRDLLVVDSDSGVGDGHGVLVGGGELDLMTTTEMKKAAEGVRVRAFGRRMP